MLSKRPRHGSQRSILEQQGRKKRTKKSRITPQWSADQQRTLERRQSSLRIQGRSLESCCQRGCLGRRVSSNSWTPKLFFLEDKPLGLKLQNIFGAFGETDSEQEIPWRFLMTFRRYRVRSTAKRSLYQRWKINTQTQKQKKETRTRPKITPKKATTGGQELYPLIRVEDKDGHPELQAVSDSSR